MKQLKILRHNLSPAGGPGEFGPEAFMDGMPRPPPGACPRNVANLILFNRCCSIDIALYFFQTFYIFLPNSFVSKIVDLDCLSTHFSNK